MCDIVAILDYFHLDLDDFLGFTFSNLDAGYILRLMQMNCGYFLDVSIKFSFYI